MAVTLMTTTGTAADVRSALGLPTAEPETSPNPVDPISATADAAPDRSAESVVRSDGETPPEPSATPDTTLAATTETSPADEAVPENEYDEDGEPLTERAQRSSRSKLRTIKHLRSRARDAELRAAKAEGELAARRAIGTPLPTETAKTTEPPAEGPPTEDQFETYETFIEAKADYRANQTVKAALEAERQRQADDRQRTQRTEAEKVIRDRVETFKATHADYDAIALNPTLPITEAMAAVLLSPANDLGPAMAYALGKDPARCQTLAVLPPHDQILALGELRAELKSLAKATPPPASKPLTTAPPPPTPVRGTSVVASVSLDDLSKKVAQGSVSASEWIARRNAEIAKRQQR